MRDELVAEIAGKFASAGIPPDFGPDNSRLLIRLWRELAEGRPLDSGAVNAMVTDLDVDREAAQEFLASVTERNDGGDIVGAVGLSLNSHPHRFSLNGSAHSTWCAWDALFLPPMLGRTAKVESRSPGSDEVVRITVSPHRVVEVSPTGAVVSILVPDPDKIDTDSVEGIWTTFCQQILFFPSQEQAEAWSADGDRESIEILTVEEAYELGKRALAELLAYAPKPAA